MRLRKRPFSSKTQKLPTLNKCRSRQEKEDRLFGTDLTNQPTPAPNQVQMEEEVAQPACQLQPYLSSILTHIDELDAAFLSQITARLMLQAQGSDFCVTPDMRRILLRWLLQVGRKFQIKHETLHICVQMIDFVLVFESHRINKANFQLLGVASLFVASKYNEIHTWEASKYIFVCDGLYTVEQLFVMEGVILSATSFNLQFPTIQQFAGLPMEQHSEKLRSMVVMLSNLALFDFTLFNRFKKRHLAVVIMYIALKLENPDCVRSRDVMEESNVPEDVFRECSRLLLGLYQERERIQA